MTPEHQGMPNEKEKERGSERGKDVEADDCKKS
jgi:hypothetical protein